jgi:hypothetical protein
LRGCYEKGWCVPTPCGAALLLAWCSSLARKHVSRPTPSFTRRRKYSDDGTAYFTPHIMESHSTWVRHRSLHRGKVCGRRCVIRGFDRGGCAYLPLLASSVGLVSPPDVKATHQPRRPSDALYLPHRPTPSTYRVGPCRPTPPKCPTLVHLCPPLLCHVVTTHLSRMSCTCGVGLQTCEAA